MIRRTTCSKECSIKTGCSCAFSPFGLVALCAGFFANLPTLNSPTGRHWHCHRCDRRGDPWRQVTLTNTGTRVAAVATTNGTEIHVNLLNPGQYT